MLCRKTLNKYPLAHRFHDRGDAVAHTIEGVLRHHGNGFGRTSTIVPAGTLSRGGSRHAPPRPTGRDARRIHPS